MLPTDALDTAKDVTSLWWLEPTPVDQMASPQPEGDLRDHTSPNSSHLTFSPRWRPKTVQRHFPPDPVQPSCLLWASPSKLSSTLSSYVTLFLHPKKEHPLWLSVNLLLHLFSLLTRMGIEHHPGPVQDPCSVCGDRVHPSWVIPPGREGFTAETERIFPYQPPALPGKKSFRRILGNAGRHHIPCGYGVLTGTSSGTSARKHKTSGEKNWRSLLESSDRATNPKHHWSHLRKLGGKRSNPPPTISIAFDGKTNGEILLYAHIQK